MEISYTLIVAIIYVTIMSIGLGNQLGSVTALAVPGGHPRPSRLRIGWMLVVLLTYFLFIWQVTALTRVESWDFARYLCVAVGPCLMVMTTGLITSRPSDGERAADSDGYFTIAPRFLLCFAAAHAWAWLFEPAMGLPASPDSLLDAAAAVVLVGTALTRSPRLHGLGLVVLLLLKVADGSVEAVGT